MDAYNFGCYIQAYEYLFVVRVKGKAIERQISESRGYSPRLYGMRLFGLEWEYTKLRKPAYRVTQPRTKGTQ